MQSMPRSSYVYAVVLLLVVILFPYDTVANASLGATIVSHSSQQVNRYSTTIEYINEMRINDSAQVLVANDSLQDVAESRAKYIADSGIFNHYEDDGSTFYSKLLSDNSTLDVACENLSMQFSEVPATAFNGWRKSPDHLACMSDIRMNSYGIATVSIKGSDNKIIKYVSVLIVGGKNE